MASIFVYEGKSDIGYQKAINEDDIGVLELNDEILLLIIADGVKSVLETRFQPAAIAIQEIGSFMQRIFKKSPDLLTQYPELFLSEALESANRVLTVFSACDEDHYTGFGCSCTCCLIYRKKDEIYATVASVGNTRLYLIRFTKSLPSIHQLTTDHTRAAEMVFSGLITEEQYYTHLDRLVLTSGLGVLPEPRIQILENLFLKKDDIILMTTDGIHYAIRPEALSDIVLQSGSCADAVKSLIEAAKLEKYADNMSAIVTYISP